MCELKASGAECTKVLQLVHPLISPGAFAYKYFAFIHNASLLCLNASVKGENKVSTNGAFFSEQFLCY